MKNEKSVLAAAIGAGLLALSLSGQASGETLKDAVEQTLKTSPDVLIDARQRLSTDEALKGARGGYLPRVDLSLGVGQERSDNSFTRADNYDWRRLTRREASLTLTQMLFDGFGVASEVARNRARVESAAYKVAGTSDQMALKTVESYLDVLRNQELVELTKENLSAHQKTFDQIRLRADAGVGRKADLDQIEARLALAKANLASAEANLRDAQTNYLRTVGATPKALAKVSPPDDGLLPKSADAAVKVSLENHPILKSAQADIKAAEAQHEAAKSVMYPRLDLELGANRSRDLGGVPGTNYGDYAMLRMRYNLLKGGSDIARVNETRQLTYEATEIMNRTARQAEQSTRLSWNALKSAQERLPSLRQHAESSEKTREAYGKQFNLGQRTLLDLLDTENEYFTARTDYVNGRYVETFARYRILADVSQLLPVLGVAAPEEARVAASQ